jgi:CRP/FNR family transcriptional regulator, nitrogen oxide reductase regulator
MMEASERVRATLRGSRLFRGVQAPFIDALSRTATLVEAREGQHVWHAGQAAQSFTVIARGLLQIQRPTPSGEPAVLGVFGPHESVGDSAALERTPYPADAVAVTDLTVVRVDAELVITSMAYDPLLAHAMQKALFDHTRALFTKIDIVSAGSVSARLATLLLHLHERFGDEDEHGLSSLPLPLSRTALSRLVSARSETVIRLLSSLQREGVLVAKPDGFDIPDLERLRELTRQG